MAALFRHSSKASALSSLPKLYKADRLQTDTKTGTEQKKLFDGEQLMEI